MGLMKPEFVTPELLLPRLGELSQERLQWLMEAEMGSVRWDYAMHEGPASLTSVQGEMGSVRWDYVMHEGPASLTSVQGEMGSVRWDYVMHEGPASLTSVQGEVSCPTVWL
jgi:carbonic anhydrase